MALNLAFLRPYFQLNDDTFKLLFAKGVGTDTTPSEYIGYSSTILGLLLKNLYTLLPRMPWYPLYLLLCHFLTATGFLYSLWIGPNSRFKTLLFLAATTAIFCYCFTDIQFTITSSLAAQGAFFLIAQVWRSENSRSLRPALLLAGILLTLSVLTRSNAFFLACLAAAPFFAFLAWKPVLTPVRVSLLKFLLAMAVLIGSLVAFDRYYYNHEPGWREFNRFDAQRVTLQDYRKAEYNPATEGVFRSVGWTSNDLNLFMGWYYMDEDIFSVEKLKKLNDYFSAFSLEGKNTDSNFPAIFALTTNQIVTLFFLTFLFFVPRRPLLLLLSNFGWVLLIFLYLNLNMRTSERLSLPTLFFILNASIFYAVPKKLSSSGNGEASDWLPKVGVVLSLLLLLYAGLFVEREHRKNQGLKYYEEVLKNSMVNFRPQKNQLYILWDSAFPFELIHAFDDFELFRDFNIITLAVYQRAPETYRMMSRFGVKNLFKDMVDNPNLFLICSQWEMNAYKTYMTEKNKMETQPETVYSTPFFAVYRIISVKKP